MAYYKKNKKRIDPRYFLNETADRDLELEEGHPGRIQTPKLKGGTVADVNIGLEDKPIKRLLDPEPVVHPLEDEVPDKEAPSFSYEETSMQDFFNLPKKDHPEPVVRPLKEKGRREILPAVAADMSEEVTDRLEQRSGLNKGPSSPAIDSVDPFRSPSLGRRRPTSNSAAADSLDPFGGVLRGGPVIRPLEDEEPDEGAYFRHSDMYKQQDPRETAYQQFLDDAQAAQREEVPSERVRQIPQVDIGPVDDSAEDITPIDLEWEREQGEGALKEQESESDVNKPDTGGMSGKDILDRSKQQSATMNISGKDIMRSHQPRKELSGKSILDRHLNAPTAAAVSARNLARGEDPGMSTSDRWKARAKIKRDKQKPSVDPIKEQEGGAAGMKKRAEKTKKQMQTSNVPGVGINTKTGKRMMAPDRPDETDENINQSLADPHSQRQNPTMPKRRAFDVLENNGKTAKSIKETIKAALREAFDRKNRK